jgi:soluble P-type ATPase
MLEIDIPGFGIVKLEHLVSDFTGTLSVDGLLSPGVKDQLYNIALFMKVHILTADTFGKARAALEGIPCEVHILTGKDHDIQKEKFVKAIGSDNVVALGNGKNDRRMLKIARIGIAVSQAEGCAVDALSAADILVTSAQDGLGLLLNTKRCKATLRF